MYRSISPSGTLLLNEQSAALMRSGKEVFRFGFGQSPFPVPEIMKKALQNFAHCKEYTPVQGLPELCDAVADFHTRHDGYNISSDRIMVAPGSKSLLYTIMMAFEKAHIFIPAPAWVSYAPQAELIGHAMTLMKADYKDQYRIRPDMLDQYLSTYKDEQCPKIVILNYPANPDGLSYTPEELIELAEVLRKYKAYIISDEIYGLLHFEGRHHSVAKFYPEGSFVTTGLSKWAGAGGWRLGTVILPENYDPLLKTTMLAVASETYSCAPAPVQHAAITAYTDPTITQFIQKERIILKSMSAIIHEALCKAHIRAHKSEGGFYMLVDFSQHADVLKEKDITTDTQLCRFLLQETGVALLPGSAFGLDASLLAARLAYVDFDGAAALEEFEQQGAWSHDLTEKYASKMLRGLRQVQALLEQ